MKALSIRRVSSAFTFLGVSRGSHLAFSGKTRNVQLKRLRHHAGNAVQ